MKRVNITKEELFNNEVVRKDTLALRNMYADEGYAYANVAPAIKEDTENNLVDITYRISKGKKVRFERINITGNTVTRDKVIRRELKVMEGEYFSRKDLKKSTGNLHRLGFFEDIEIQTLKGTEDDLMVLDVNVKERPTGSFSLGAGYSSFDDAIGMAQVSQNNLFGFGQKLQLAAKLGGRTTEFDIKFIEPWLLDTPISTSVNFYKWKREYDEYTKDSFGGALGFGFLLGFDDFTRGSIKYAYDDAELIDIAQDASFIIKDQEGTTVTSSIKLGINRNSTDRPFHTTEGSVNSLSMEYAGGFLGGDASFTKYLASTAWYFPLPLKTVFLARGNWGYIDERSDGELPIYQKFRLGGINSIRGFEFADISPRDPKTGDRIGGEKMMFYNLEYRFPLIKEQGVVGLVFFDTGNVFTADEGFSFSGIKKSIGTGIRWFSPVGPIRVEYGKNLDPVGDESSGEVEFAVGGTF
jgi:outer membrane protein insertion porin family